MSQKKMKRKVKDIFRYNLTKTKHRKDCTAVRMVKEKHWTTEWADECGILEGTNLIIPCNDPKCKAKIKIDFWLWNM